MVIAFDGQGKKNSSETLPTGVQVFYSASKKTADDILERLVAKYSNEHDMTVAQTVITFGGIAISVESLLSELECSAADVARRIRDLRRR